MGLGSVPPELFPPDAGLLFERLTEVPEDIHPDESEVAGDEHHLGLPVVQDHDAMVDLVVNAFGRAFPGIALQRDRLVGGNIDLVAGGAELPAHRLTVRGDDDQGQQARNRQNGLPPTASLHGSSRSLASRLQAALRPDRPFEVLAGPHRVGMVGTSHLLQDGDDLTVLGGGFAELALPDERIRQDDCAPRARRDAAASAASGEHRVSAARWSRHRGDFLSP